jgi:limonene-1,2-epoxide hydrolase
MLTPTETVMAFLGALAVPGGFADGIRGFFTAETRYLNVGLSDTTGIDEAVAFVARFETATGANALRIEMLAICEAGNKVLTERIDHLIAPDGRIAVSIPLMGVFEVAGGKITAWRDYFDTAGMVQGKPAGG